LFSIIGGPVAEKKVGHHWQALAHKSHAPASLTIMWNRGHNNNNNMVTTRM